VVKPYVSFILELDRFLFFNAWIQQRHTLNWFLNSELLSSYCKTFCSKRDNNVGSDCPWWHITKTWSGCGRKVYFLIHPLMLTITFRFQYDCVPSDLMTKISHHGNQNQTKSNSQICHQHLWTKVAINITEMNYSD